MAQWLIGGGVAAALSYLVFKKPMHLPVKKEYIPTPNHPAAEVLATQGVGVAPSQHLQEYLRAHGFDGSPTLKSLITEFQTAYNEDAEASKVFGKLPVTGVYDTVTSARLTFYTKDPIPADPSSPLPAKQSGADLTDSTKATGAYLSGYNLQEYLKKNGNDKSETLVALVKQFQYDINTDPKYPGPAYGLANLPKFVTSPLKVDGAYGDATAKALGPITDGGVSQAEAWTKKKK